MSNIFTLSFSLPDTIEPRDNGIDGVLLIPHIKIKDINYDFYYIDVEQLIDSALAPGEYHIFNCSCGEPSCAGLDDGIIVLHQQHAVEWKVPVPLAVSNMEATTDARVYKTENVGTLPNYRKAILDGLHQAKQLIAESKHPVFLKPMWTDIPRLFRHGDDLMQAEQGAAANP